MQDKPELFSTFMLWMLATFITSFRKSGTSTSRSSHSFSTKRTCCSTNASKALLDQIQQVVRLIRSKGVGVYFVTQSPKDIPEEVLGQLGHRVQHALRAFTPDDDKALRAAARTFPKTTFYDVEETLTTLGTGEALVTVLSPKGVPTQPFAVRLIPPASKMAPMDDIDQQIAKSMQVRRYATPIDRESAREKLAARILPGATADCGRNTGGWDAVGARAKAQRERTARSLRADNEISCRAHGCRCDHARVDGGAARLAKAAEHQKPLVGLSSLMLL